MTYYERHNHEHGELCNDDCACFQDTTMQDNLVDDTDLTTKDFWELAKRARSAGISNSLVEAFERIAKLREQRKKEDWR